MLKFQSIGNILQHFIAFLGPDFPGMRGLILALMSNVCYLAVIMIFLVVTARYLVVTAHYLVVTARYWWLLLVTGGYCLLLLIPTFSMNVKFGQFM